MEYVRGFKRLDRNNTAIAGGKGASLGEMVQSGIPVPPGFVVLAGAYERFIDLSGIRKKIERILGNVKPKNIRSIATASRSIQSVIVGHDVPTEIGAAIMKSFVNLGASYVAVRSSATAEDGATSAWAGQLETYLNVTQAQLLEHVKRCWASLYTPRAISYRFEKKLTKQKISVAVVIQKMVVSEASGIGFSVHPVSQDPNQLVIEAGLGLGESIVSGQITPDRYLMTKKPLRIFTRSIAKKTRGIFRGQNGGSEWKPIAPSRVNKSALSSQQTLRLARLIVRIERLYGFPVDMEWALEKGKIFVVQSRPITTLRAPKSVGDPETVTLEQEFQRPTTVSLFQIWLWGHTKLFKKLGLPENEAQMVYGQYCQGIVRGFTPVGNIERLKSAILAHGERRVLSEIHQYVGHWNQLGRNPAKVKDQTFITDLAAGFILTFLAGDLPTSRIQRAAYSARVKTEHLFPQIEKFLRRISQNSKQFSKLTYEEVLRKTKLSKKIAQSRNEFRIDGSGCSKPKLYNEPHVFQQVMNRSLSVMLCEYWDAGERLALPRAFGNSIFFDPLFIFRPGRGVAIYYDFSDPRQAYDGFIRYCQRHHRELTTWRSEFEQDCRTILGLVASPQAKDFDRLFSLLVKIWPMIVFSNVFGSFIPDQVPPWIANVAKILRKKYDRVLYLGDAALAAMARHLVAKSYHPYIQYLRMQEVKGLERVTVKELRLRKNGYIFFHGTLTVDPVDTMLKSHRITFGNQKTKKQDTLQGVVAQGGVATGSVRVIFQTSQLSSVKLGDILVAPMTTPDFLPAMQRAAAFVTDEGGITCHAAIMAREMGKPCVIATQHATKMFRNGDHVRVDADRGVVSLIE